MSTVPTRWDHAISWVVNPGADAPHDRKPVFLSDYVDALEALVRSGDSGPNDLQRLRTRLGLGPDVAPRPRTVAAMPSPEYVSDFSTHRWVGFEQAECAHCQVCGVSSNSLMAMKKCGYKA